MTLFNGSKNNSCKGAKKFAASFFCAKNTNKFMVNFCADTAIAVSVLLFVIICHALVIPVFLIISSMIINIIIKNNLWQNTALSQMR